MNNVPNTQPKVYRIADILYAFDNKHTCLMRSTDKFISDKAEYDFFIDVSPEDIANEKMISRDDSTNWGYRSAATLRKLAATLPKKNAMLFHSAAFDVEGVGVAFAAASGTGKTTHMQLWKEYLGDKMTVINGDKPLVRIFYDNDVLPEGTQTGIPYVYGSPWMGKENYGCNMRSPLKHICFIERSEKNCVESLDKSKAVIRMLQQVNMPPDPVDTLNTMKIIDKMLSYCKLWIIHCNIENDAAIVAYDSIFKK